MELDAIVRDNIAFQTPLESWPRPEFSGHPPTSSSQCFFSRPTYFQVSLKTKVLLASFGNSATGTSRRTFKPPPAMSTLDWRARHYSRLCPAAPREAV